jgi:ribonuclease Z
MLTGLAIVLALAAAGWALLQVPAVDACLFRRVVAARVQAAPVRLAGQSELSVLLCGTGSPLPDPTRAGPCTLLAAGDRLYLVDAGLDSARNLALANVAMDRIAGILITHLHSDHIAELGELRLQTWVAGRRQPLSVYGPPGIERVVAGFNEAYAIDAGYRVAHHGANLLPPEAVALVARPLPIVEGTTALVLDEDGLRITAIRVDHGPVKPAYGYRFDFARRSIVVSGDTAPSPELARAALGVDVLVHEALSPEMVAIMQQAMAAAGRSRQAQIFADIPGYHTSPVAAARLANEAGVRLLVYTHLIPMLPYDFLRQTFLRGVHDVRPRGVHLGSDGYLVRLPGMSQKIDESQL